MEKKTITKREFLKLCALCSAGIAFGMSGLGSLARGAVRMTTSSSSSDELWKWSKEALFYRKTGDGLECQKCPNGCILMAGDFGICRNRVNYDGKMYSIAYGNPCAVHIDPIEKKPFFHFLPRTRAFSVAVAGCTLSCLNCQNWEISQFSPKETQNYDLMPDRTVEECLKYGAESIAYTYSEPTTFYEYAYDTAVLARKKKIRNVWKSNGYINEQPLRHLCKVMDAANIDLKSFEESIYRKLNGGHVEPVLRSLKIFKEEGVWLEITNLIIPTWTDDLETIKRMCDWLVKNGLHDCPLHFSRFNPLYKLTQLPVTPVSTLERAKEIAMKSGLQYVYIGNVPGHTAENTYCHKCSKMIIERRGFAILQNNLERGNCRFCGAHVPGVWS